MRPDDLTDLEPLLLEPLLLEPLLLEPLLLEPLLLERLLRDRLDALGPAPRASADQDPSA